MLLESPHFSLFPRCREAAVGTSGDLGAPALRSALAVRGASAPTAWPAQGSKAPEAAAVSGLTMRDFGSGEWVLFFGRMGPVFFFCGYGIMKIYCVIGLFFFFTCVCVFFGMQI